MAMIIDGKRVETPFACTVGSDIEKPNSLWFPKLPKRPWPTQVLLHHTAGEGDARAIYRVLQNRKLSIHFTIDYYGIVTQMADIISRAAHGGTANAQSIGIEIANRAVPPMNAKRPRLLCEDTLRGKKRTFLQFTRPQVESTRLLLKFLSKSCNIQLTLPLEGDKSMVLRRTMTPKERSVYRGVLGHWHVSSRKIDLVPHLMDELAREWGLLR